MSLDELESALKAFDAARNQTLESERALAASRGKFRQEFMQACHREWTKTAEELVRLMGNSNHRVELTLAQEAHQEMMVMHIRPNLKDLGYSLAQSFDFTIKVYPNEAMQRVCVKTVTPDQPEYIGRPETFRIEDLAGDNFKHVLSRHLATIVRAAMPRTP